MIAISGASASRYSPPTSFRPVTLDAVAGFVMARPICTLVAAGEGRMLAASVPVVIDRLPDGTLEVLGHVSRLNQPWGSLPPQAPGLAIFTREDLRDRHGAPAPDEIFAAVHLHARLTVIDDLETVLAGLIALGERHEAGRSHVWNARRLAPGRLRHLAGEVLAVRLLVESAEACAPDGATLAEYTCERRGG